MKELKIQENKLLILKSGDWHVFGHMTTRGKKKGRRECSAKVRLGSGREWGRHRSWSRVAAE